MIYQTNCLSGIDANLDSLAQAQHDVMTMKNCWFCTNIQHHRGESRTEWNQIRYSKLKLSCLAENFMEFCKAFLFLSPVSGQFIFETCQVRQQSLVIRLETNRLRLRCLFAFVVCSSMFCVFLHRNFYVSLEFSNDCVILKLSSKLFISCFSENLFFAQL